VAFIVALPSELGSMDWHMASEKLVRDMHGGCIIALIFVDVIVGAWFLQDDRTKAAIQQNAIKILSVLVVVGLSLFVLARSNSGTSLWTWIGAVGVVIFAMLFFLRFWTYHSVVRVNPIDKPTFKVSS
jgi:protein-S-isoprenylcysteine O-methyltransferase Ste14